MTFLADLITARDGLTAKLAADSANPRPDYSVAGRSVSWSAYRADLIAQIRDLTQQIINAQGGIEIQTSAYG
ncbi:MAG TPA: hypothetical protein VMX97_01305 [Hyphomicrobiaceae bacterium]|nr:hypothetical protein [Hyphomicrobiaceae bacterium]